MASATSAIQQNQYNAVIHHALRVPSCASTACSLPVPTRLLSGTSAHESESVDRNCSNCSFVISPRAKRRAAIATAFSVSRAFVL